MVKTKSKSKIDPKYFVQYWLFSWISSFSLMFSHVCLNIHCYWQTKCFEHFTWYMIVECRKICHNYSTNPLETLKIAEILNLWFLLFKQKVLLLCTHMFMYIFNVFLWIHLNYANNIDIYHFSWDFYFNLRKIVGVFF
jgi:hypothetical protein